MQTTNRLLDDLAKVAGGAMETLGGVRNEVQGMVSQQRDRLIAELDLVPREEFEAVRAVAAAARSENDALSARLADLEARIAKLEGSER